MTGQRGREVEEEEGKEGEEANEEGDVIGRASMHVFFFSLVENSVAQALREAVEP